jgi:hypothetical protein
LRDKIQGFVVAHANDIVVIWKRQK